VHFNTVGAATFHVRHAIINL